MNDEIILIPIDRIRILNPRHRDKKKFEVIVQSIKNLGLKKPIQVSLRNSKEEENEAPGYDLVCGQGRIEAFQALGFQSIPAVVVEVSKEERLLRSIVENMARRFPVPADLLHEIERLKALKYSNAAIGKKLDISDSLVSGFLALKEAGEERLLNSALAGQIPLGVAMEIAKADTAEAQRELLKAYESKQLTGSSIRIVKRLMDQRRYLGKREKSAKSPTDKVKPTADGMVRVYQRVVQRQKIMIRKGNLCSAKLSFMVQAFSKLLTDDAFVKLIQSEGFATLPSFLSSEIESHRKEAA